MLLPWYDGCVGWGDYGGYGGSGWAMPSKGLAAHRWIVSSCAQVLEYVMVVRVPEPWCAAGSIFDIDAQLVHGLVRASLQALMFYQAC